MTIEEFLRKIVEIDLTQAQHVFHDWDAALENYDPQLLPAAVPGPRRRAQARHRGRHHRPDAHAGKKRAGPCLCAGTHGPGAAAARRDRPAAFAGDHPLPLHLPGLRPPPPAEHGGPEVPADDHPDDGTACMMFSHKESASAQILCTGTFWFFVTSYAVRCFLSAPGALPAAPVSGHG